MSEKQLAKLLQDYHTRRIIELRDPSYNQTQLAEWFDINPTLFNHYYLGRRAPGDKNIEKLADKLGPQVYDILGRARPDNRLAEMRAEYDTVPEEVRDDYLEEIKKLTHKFLTERGYRLVDHSTPKSL